MPKTYEQVSERIREDLEQIFSQTTQALERVTKAQVELVYLTTDTMIRGYFGILNGTTGAIMQSYAGFLDGFSRAWARVPDKPAKTKSSKKAGGKPK